MFITFEGGEGTGKTTQINRFKSYLEKRGHSVLLLREPGGSPKCEKIRQLLLEAPWQPVTEAFLFNANRHELCETVIKPALTAKMTILCDRFMDSTMVYQGYGLGLDPVFLQILQNNAVTVMPHHTFIFDIDPSVARARLQSRSSNNYIDERPLSFHEKIRCGFLDIAKHNAHRCHVIDAKGTEDDVFKSLLVQWEPLEQFL